MQVFSAPSASISSSPTLLEEKKDALSSDADQKLIVLAFQNDISSIKKYFNETNPNILTLKDKRDYTRKHENVLIRIGKKKNNEVLLKNKKITIIIFFLF